MKKILLLTAGIAAAAGSLFAQDQVIREQPEGTLRTFHGYSIASYSSWGFLAEDPHDGLARQVVFADNGDVYFKDPISKMPYGTWIKGTLKDGVITVETPQLFDQSEFEGETLNWMVQRLVGTTHVDEDGYETIEWNVDTEKTAITYTFRNDSIIQDQEGKLVKLGLTLDGKEQIYGDRDVVYTAVDEKSTKVPEDAKTEKWSLRYNTSYFSQIDMAFKDNEVFITGLWEEFPSATIKGTVTEDRILIDSQQYLGFLYSENYGYYTYLMAADIIPAGYTTCFLTSSEPFALKYDRENKTLIPVNPKQGLAIRYGKTAGVEEYYSRKNYKDIEMAYIDHIDALLTPEITRIMRDYEYGWGYIEFSIPAQDILGNSLDVNKYSYSIFLDDEKLVFDPDFVFVEQYKYKWLDGPTSELAFLFDNDSAISTTGSPGAKKIMYYELGFDEIGVQTYYHDDISGKDLQSNIAYINPETTEIRIVDVSVGVESITDGNAEIANVEFFDLTGNRVDSSFKGVTIKVVTYTDGTIKTFKQMVR